MKLLFFLLSLLIIQSCASKKEEGFANKIFGLFEDVTKTIVKTQMKVKTEDRPVLPQSYKVAVFFKEPNDKAKTPQKWKWTQQDKEKILTTVKNSKSKVGKVFELIDLGSEKSDAESLRLMASQQGADALLLIQGVSEVDSDPNGLALTYLAIVPAFFVNGNHVDGTFVSQALLWDVEEPYVHLGVQNEGAYSHKRPLVFRQVPRVIEKSKEESLEGLSAKLKSEFTQI